VPKKTKRDWPFSLGGRPPSTPILRALVAESPLALARRLLDTPWALSMFGHRLPQRETSRTLHELPSLRGFDTWAGLSLLAVGGPAFVDFVPGRPTGKTAPVYYAQAVLVKPQRNSQTEALLRPTDQRHDDFESHGPCGHALTAVDTCHAGFCACLSSGLSGRSVVWRRISTTCCITTSFRPSYGRRPAVVVDCGIIWPGGHSGYTDHHSHNANSLAWQAADFE
jgi:hypothetical protein